MTELQKPTGKPIFSQEKKRKLFAGLGSVCIVKNCDLGLENAALDLPPWAAFSRPRSQFFTIGTSVVIVQHFTPRSGLGRLGAYGLGGLGA